MARANLTKIVLLAFGANSLYVRTFRKFVIIAKTPKIEKKVESIFLLVKSFT